MQYILTDAHVLLPDTSKGSINVLLRIFFRVLLMWRLVFDASGELYRELGVPAVVLWYMHREAKPRLWSHGIGRFTQQEVVKIMEDDLSAISTILGKYFC